jgi:hypothetical protein
LRRLLNLAQLLRSVRKNRIEEHREDSELGRQLAQEFQPFGIQSKGQPADPGDVTAGSIEAGDETELHGIGAAREDDRNGRRGRLGRE